MKRYLPFVLIAVVAVALSLAFAGHTVGNPATWSLTPVENPVKWVPGNNAGSTDIDGSTITVDISPNGSVASVSATVTYGENQYIDVLRVNVSGGPFNIWLWIDPMDIDPNIIDTAKSYIRIYNVNISDTVATLYLSDMLSNHGLGTVGALDDAQYQVDLVLYVKDGISLPSSIEIDMKLFYSKASEQPIVP